MTISQALRQIKKVKGQLGESLSRGQANVSHKTSVKPAFQFSTCMDKADVARASLVDLETRVAITNATTMISHRGRTMALVRAVRQLQELKAQIAWLRGLTVRNQAHTADQELEYRGAQGHVHVDIPWTCHLPEAERAAKVDTIQQEFDALNDAVETTNHVTFLVESELQEPS
jgi:hypothetical protein